MAQHASRRLEQQEGATSSNTSHTYIHTWPAPHTTQPFSHLLLVEQVARAVDRLVGEELGPPDHPVTCRCTRVHSESGYNAVRGETQRRRHRENKGRNRERPVLTPPTPPPPPLPPPYSTRRHWGNAAGGGGSDECVGVTVDGRTAWTHLSSGAFCSSVRATSKGRTRWAASGPSHTALGTWPTAPVANTSW